MTQDQIDQQGNIYIQRDFVQAQDLQQAGIEMEKSWSAVEDGKDCEMCINNQKAGWIPLNASFPSGHQIPLGHTGCRCEIRVRRKPDTSITPKTIKRPYPKKAINILIIVFVSLCCLCLALGFILNTFFPAQSIATTQPQITQPTSAPASTKSPATKYLQEYGGSEQTYLEILTSTDCKFLQEKFDTAYANNQRETPGTEQFRWTVGFMTATDDRMREIGCY